MILLKHPFPIPLLPNIKYMPCPESSNFFKLKIIMTVEVVKRLAGWVTEIKNGALGHLSTRFPCCASTAVTCSLPERPARLGALECASQAVAHPCVSPGSLPPQGRPNREGVGEGEEGRKGSGEGGEGGGERKWKKEAEEREKSGGRRKGGGEGGERILWGWKSQEVKFLS